MRWGMLLGRGGGGGEGAIRGAEGRVGRKRPRTGTHGTVADHAPETRESIVLLDLAPFTLLFQAPVRFAAETVSLLFPAVWLRVGRSPTSIPSSATSFRWCPVSPSTGSTRRPGTSPAPSSTWNGRPRNTSASNSWSASSGTSMIRSRATEVQATGSARSKAKSRRSAGRSATLSRSARSDLDERQGPTRVQRHEPVRGDGHLPDDFGTARVAPGAPVADAKPDMTNRVVGKY